MSWVLFVELSCAEALKCFSIFIVISIVWFFSVISLDYFSFIQVSKNFVKA